MTRISSPTILFVALITLPFLVASCADMPSDYELWPREDGDSEILMEDTEDMEDAKEDTEDIIVDGDKDVYDKDTVEKPQTGTAYICATAFDGTYDMDAQQADFGMVRVDSRPGSVHLAVWNCGDSKGDKMLEIRRINLQDETGAFSIDAPDVGGEKPLWLPPQGSGMPEVKFAEIWLHYEPTEATAPGQYHEASLMIRNNSDAETQQRFVISMRGQAEVFGLNITPEVINFGQVPYGGSGDRTVSISNATPNDIVVAGFSITSTSELPDTATSFIVAQLGGSGDLYLEPDEDPLTVSLKYNPKPLVQDEVVVERNDEASFHIRWCFTFQDGCALCDDPTDTTCMEALSQATTSTAVPLSGTGIPGPTNPEQP